MNPFTDESRTERLEVSVLDFCRQLRAPASLKALIFVAKPAFLGLGDWILKACLDAWLIGLIKEGRYRDVQTTLASLFGAVPTGVSGADGRPR